MNIRKDNIITGPDVPNGKKVYKSINLAKKASRQLQKAGKSVSKHKVK